MNLLISLRTINFLIILGVFYCFISFLYTINTIKYKFFKNITINIFYCIKENIFTTMIFIILFFIIVKYIDLPTILFFQHNYNSFVYKLFDVINMFGEGWFVASTIILIMLISFLFNKKKIKVISTICLCSLIYSGLINVILKLLINRERPGIKLNPNLFFYYIQNKHRMISDLFYASNSMPSGHTIAVTSVLTPIILFTKNIYLKLFLSCLILLIIFARVYTINHWVSDIYVATIVGIIIGKIFYHQNKYLIIN